MGIFSRRPNDYEIKKSQDKSLIKKASLFTKISPNEPNSPKQFGGVGGALGPHVKQSKNPNKKASAYFLAEHNALSEYLALEVLNKVKFNTPKARIIHDLKLATKEIEGYTPLAAFIHKKKKGPDNKELDEEIIPSDIMREKYLLDEIYKKYRLDFKKQVIVDIKTGKEYKISGNLFATDIGARLVQDGDFHPERLNVGLVRVGDRFYAHLIDKDQVLFDGARYEDAFINRDIEKSELYSSVESDQKFFIIDKVQDALNNKDFDKIFLGSRILSSRASSSVDKDERVMKELKDQKNNFEKTARSAVEYFENKYPGGLKRFQERERLRSQLAATVIARLGLLLDKEDKDALKEIIMEDLRGPYYEGCANISKKELKNEALINQIVQDQARELKALGITSTNILLDDLEQFFISESKRVSSEKSKSKAEMIDVLISSIAEIKKSFPNKPLDEKKTIIKSIVKNADIITHHSEKTPWITAQSEKNWLAFKSNHQTELLSIDPSMDIKKKLKSARTMKYDAYSRIFQKRKKPNDKVLIDLESEEIRKKI